MRTLKTLVVLLCVVVFVSDVVAQAPDTLWTYQYGWISNFDVFGPGPIAESNSGNIYTLIKYEYTHLCCTFCPYLLCLSSSGDSLWSMLPWEYCYDDVYTWGNDLLLVGDSAIVSGGESSDGYLPGFGVYYWETFRVAMIHEAQLLWSYQFNHLDSLGWTDCLSTFVLNDSVLVAIGEDSPGPTEDTDAIMIKLNRANGQALDTSYIDYGGRTTAVCGVSLPFGRYVVGGRAYLQGGERKGFVTCFDSTGMKLWDHEFQSGAMDEVISLQVRRDSVLVVGFAGAPTIRLINPDGYILDSLFITQQSSKILWGSDSSYSILSSSLGKFDWTGAQVWVSEYSGESFARKLDRGYLFTRPSSSWGSITLVVATQPDNTTTFFRMMSPDAGERPSIFSIDTIQWFSAGVTGGVSIQLNRYYPNNIWETISDSTENDGSYEWFVTDPLSDSCRIRICALQDTFCDISDGNFSIVSSQGYLGLVRSSAPSSPILSWSAVGTECPGGANQSFRIKNFGSEPIVAFQPLEPASAEFSRTTTCDSFFALAPGGISTCSVTVSFSPTGEGIFLDTLRIQTDAVNGVGGFVSIPLSGSQIRTPESPEVVISTAGNNAALRWSPIVESIGHCQIDPPSYLVFFAENNAGPFWFHGVTADTAYTHVGAVQYASAMFYHVHAVKGDPGMLASLPRGSSDNRVLEADIMKHLCKEARWTLHR